MQRRLISGCSSFWSFRNRRCSILPRLSVCRNQDDLVDAMQRFIDNPELVTQMGERSRQVAEQKYDVHRVNEFMLAEMGVK